MQWLRWVEKWVRLGSFFALRYGETSALKNTAIWELWVRAKL
jgi:hypothetical protein